MKDGKIEQKSLAWWNFDETVKRTVYFQLLLLHYYPSLISSVLIN